MKISPINNNYYQKNTSFKSKIIKTELIQASLNVIDKSINRAEAKSMNYAKEFFDNINTIKASKRANEVGFYLDDASHTIIVKEDGKIFTTENCNENYDIGYVTTQIIKKYAEFLNMAKPHTLLDNYKQNLEDAYAKFIQAKNNYRKYLGTLQEDFSKNL